MIHKVILLLISSIALLVGLACIGKLSGCSLKQPGQIDPAYSIRNKNQIEHIFPKNTHDIDSLVKKAKYEARQSLHAIIDVPKEEKTFENTAAVLDRAVSFNFSIVSTLISLMPLVTSDNALRESANKAHVELSEFFVDMFSQNIELYNAFKAYANGNALQENLSAEQRYFIKETMDDFQRSGLHLPQDKRAQVTKIIKELAQLTVDFENNIHTDARSLTVTRDQLAGLDDDFIQQLEKTADGAYILTTAYPIYFQVIEHCSVEKTRKDLSDEFNNRAYPKNLELLDTIISLRDQLAQLLGFESFAALNIDGEMAASPQTVQNFLDTLMKKGMQKQAEEVTLLLTDLPPSVQLVNGKVKPWDITYIRTSYKKKHYNLDNREIAQYFPMEHTTKKLLGIYEQFFSIQLKEAPITNLWNPEVTLIEVYKPTQTEPIGYLLLDLYPRPNKYKHACQVSVIPGVIASPNNIPALAVVLANFTKSTAQTPSLLNLDEVRTFFHEFGHAIHTLLGATQLASFSGTRVKTDFVEMPSQMLEEWLWDKEILKQLSHHYKTHEPLPDELITKIIGLKNFSSGSWIIGQLLYSLMSLDYYGPGKDKDTMSMMNELKRTLMPHLIENPNDHKPASFDHLIGYGARYYSYLWSKVFALDLFNYIKQQGLLNPAIGTKYETNILSKGGSQHPQQLLEEFLGRKPSHDAFFKDLGI
jgi:thimet oligopeptidase